MTNPYLIFEHEPQAGEHVRIWLQGDGRFAFEHLQASGKGTTIACPTLADAMLLWKQIKRRLAALQPVSDGTPTLKEGGGEPPGAGAVRV